MTLLTNEERLARKRAAWKRQQEQRKKDRMLISTKDNRRSGVPDDVYRERLISPAMITVGLHYFWVQQRGHSRPPITAAGVMQ